MLVLTLDKNQKLRIGSDIRISCDRISRDGEAVPKTVSLAVEAPDDVRILREELINSSSRGLNKP